jgi:hypothetical protein
LACSGTGEPSASSHRMRVPARRDWAWLVAVIRYGHGLLRSGSSPAEGLSSGFPSPGEPRADGALIKALEAHVETLKAQLAAAEARAAEDAMKARQALAAFSLLAERLDALAQKRAATWWRRLMTG